MPAPRRPALRPCLQRHDRPGPAPPRAGPAGRGRPALVHVRRHRARLRLAGPHPGLLRRLFRFLDGRSGRGGAGAHPRDAGGDRRAPVRQRVRRGRTRFHVRPPRPRSGFRCGTCVRLFPRRDADRELGPGRDLSFHATKAFSTFEGGAVLTNDPDLDARIRALRNFGFRGYDDVAWLGLNGKLPESSAALGLASLPVLEERRARCRATTSSTRTASGMSREWRSSPLGRRAVELPLRPRPRRRRGLRGVTRPALPAPLGRRTSSPGATSIRACTGWQPTRRGVPTVSLPVTEAVSERILCLPSGFADPIPTVEKIVGLFREARARSDDLRRREPTQR